MAGLLSADCKRVIPAVAVPAAWRYTPACTQAQKRRSRNSIKA